MNNFNFRSNWQFVTSQSPQWRTLITRDLLDRGIVKDQKHAEKLSGNVIELKHEAMPIYEKIAKVMQKSYEEKTRDDYGSTPEEKLRGLVGNDAIQSVLNHIDYGYQVDQIMSFYDEDRIFYDFILYPSKIRVEVKTSGDFADEKWYMLINKKHWQDSVEKYGVPDCVIALKQYARKDTIMLQFMGWVYGQEVANFEPHDGYMCPDAPCLRRKGDDLNKAPKLTEFLAGIAERGEEYLAKLTKQR